MFRPMRRIKQQLTERETIEILERCTSGVLAVSGDDGYPYAVPISYAYLDGKIIMHCANTGHKFDAIKANPKVSFCVTDADVLVPEKYTTLFRSAIAFGKAEIIEDDETRIELMRKLADRYRSGHENDREKEIAASRNNFSIIVINIEHITGKESIEFVNMKK